MPQTVVSIAPEEISHRAHEIYENHLRHRIESENSGRLIAIDVDSADYEVGTDSISAVENLRSRRPEGIIHLLRIGYPAAVFQGGRRRYANTNDRRHRQCQ